MIEYRNISKSFGDKEVLHDINLTIEDGEFVVVVGSSGCGKTTTVKLLNRLIDATKGEILIDGVNTMDIDEVKLRTSIGYVIQQIGLFPNMTVEQNISVVPGIMKWDRQKTKKRVKELMDMVNMPFDEYALKYPRQLSGGQQQRIGVLRALAVNPPIMIMDEPFGALDPITREILQTEVKKIQKESGITVLFITHDMHEAIKLADRIIFMDQGNILQDASPKEILMHPANEIVSRFMSLQEVTTREALFRAADLMQDLNGAVDETHGIFVKPEDPIDQLAQQYSLEEGKKIYVKDRNGRVVGEITATAILRLLQRR